MINIILYTLMFASMVNPIEKERWLVEESSRLVVEGSSNVNDFECSIQSRTRKDTLTIDYDERSQRINFVKNEVLINARTFDCQNDLITSDLKKTLKTDKYPHVTLRFLSLERPTFRNFSSQRVRGIISITIAGHTERYHINYRMTPRTDGTIILEGEQILNITDFGLTTPKKLMGLIRVNENIKVDFNMRLKPLL